MTIPAIGLSLWATGGALPVVSLGRVLAHFVLPAAATMALAGLVVFLVILGQSGDVDYTQLVLTYALVAMGLLLVIFIKPPLSFSRDRLVVKGDLRPTILVLFCALSFLVLTHIPLAQRLFDIAPLQQPSHYLVVGAIVLVWALGVQLIWLAVPLQPRERVTG